MHTRIFAACALSIVACTVDLRAQAKPGGAAKGTAGAPAIGGSPAVRREAPGDDYFDAFVPYYSGEYRVALAAFQNAAKGGIRSTDGRWVDSICYHAMIGECYYQMGSLPQALDQYNSALKIYLAYQDWMLRVSFPPNLAVQTGVLKNPVNWGVSNRNVAIGKFDDKYLALQGHFNNQAVLERGGALSDPQQFPLHVKEIVRCVILSLRRRAELLGPVGPYDPMTTMLVSACSRKLTTPGHWSQTWCDVQLGMALLATGKSPQAASELERGLLAGGQFEHPFSCAVLLELGRIALLDGKYDLATNLFLESTYSAGTFGQLDVLEEAFRGAVQAHLAAGRREPFTALVPAAAWSARLSVPLRASLFVLMADNLSQLGETQQALAALEDARREIGRHDAGSGALGARFQYELAKVNFQSGNLPAGNKALAAAMNYQTNGGSLRLFHTGLVDAAWTSGSVKDRAADQLYADVLREPTPRDWSLNAMEALATMVAPQPVPLENWFVMNLLRNEPERAFEITDRARRQKFYSSLTLGGRLLALRWVLHSPENLLPDVARLQRQDLMAKYPRYADLARQSTELSAEIGKHPLTPDNADQNKPFAERYESLLRISQLQEIALHEMALRRDPAELVFPPPLRFKEFRKNIDKSQIVLSFFATSNGLYAFQVGADRFEHWMIERPAKIRADIAELLKKWGLTERNKQVDLKELQSDDWQTIAARIPQQLVKTSRPEDWDEIRELVIVPDGPLWYCPFEALPVSHEESTVPMLQRFRVRYVPTVALAIGDPRKTRPTATTAVVTGRMFPKDDLQLTRDAAEKLESAVPRVQRLPGKLPASSSLIGKFCDRVVVYHDMDDCEKMPYDWSPIQVDKGKPGSSLAAWFSLPWGAPEQIVLPGFHTVAETALKKNGNGDEVFLSLCGLMASGTRTVLLSRWRVAGKSTTDLTREFVQELPHATADAAWQRSVQLLSAAELELEAEPRIRSGAGGPLRGEHPFFWAGYLLADTGAIPEEPESEPAGGAAGRDAAPEKADPQPKKAAAAKAQPLPGNG